MSAPAGATWWRSVSPSQIVAYKTCPRRWYNASILNDREPSKGFQLRGDAIHKALEVYMMTGEVLPTVTLKDPFSPTGETVFPTMEFVQVAKDYLPPPVTNKEWWAAHKAADGGAMVEQAGELATYEGGPELKQFIDLVVAYSKDPETIRHAGARAAALISDYKTSSSFRYAKTPEEISNDTQLNLNARWLFSVSDYEEIELRLLYLNTKNKTPTAKPVSVVVTRASVEKVWQRDMETVRVMQSWAALNPPSADALPPNTDSCGIYGGCYYKPKCFGSAGSPPLTQITKGPTTMSGSILDMLIKQKSANAAPAPAAAPPGAPSGAAAGIFAKAPPAAAPAPAAAAPPAAAAAPPPGLTSLFKKAPPAAPSMASVPPEVMAQKSADLAAAHLPGAAPTPAPYLAPEAILSGDVGISPPDAPSGISTPEEVAAANAADAAPAPAAEDAAAPAPAAEAAPPARRGPGRPKKVVAAEAPAPAPAEASAPVEAAAPAPVVPIDATLDKVKEILNTPDKSYTCPVQVLFIDCMPSKGWPGETAPVSLMEFMAKFETLAAQSAKALDYRLIRYESKGYLALAIKVLMAGLPEAIYIDSRTPGADVFESVVTPYVSAVFRGTR